MLFKRGLLLLLIAATVLASLSPSCKTQKRKTAFDDFKYEQFRDSVLRTDTVPVRDTANIFDKPEFTPGIDSLDNILAQIDTLLRREAALAERLDTLRKGIKKVPGFTDEEKMIIRANIGALDSFLAQKKVIVSGGCKGKDCIVYAEIDKSVQRLYLYILGEIKDTFLVSTGKGKKYETPNMNVRPAGPVLIKYTSRKFPGGNYMGLGNMPYAVFVRGGYAIHGTTPGNFSKLGNTASHGCIRVHPDNAKIFNALVRTVGLSQTWVTIKDSL